MGPGAHTDSAETQTLLDGDGPLGMLPKLVRGMELGRYVVLEMVGSGGMGEVVRAYDPKLRREVAIKRLHAGALDDEGEARLLREAQAMAQLSHPNVVSVFDVDRTEKGVIMAMEFVEGVTLRKWLEQHRPWRDVLERMIAAARALEAAHSVGLAHRDFKPGNVMLAEETRGRVSGVKVMDFGLARAASDLVESEPELLPDSFSGSGEHDSLSDPLTRQGVMLGTPPYMAPEQHAGAIADARSDQYSFCVALWEALYGDRPFRGVMAKLAVAKHEGAPPPPKGPVPRWVYEVVAKGLEVSPPSRFASMTEVIAALDRDPARTRARVLMIGLAAGALVGLGALASQLGGGADTTASCPDPATELEGVWDDARRSEVDAVIRGRKLSYGDDTAARVASRLNAFADAWLAQKRDACEATHVRLEQSADLLDRRTACLARRRLALVGVVDVLASADDDNVVERAADVIADLPPLAPCADLEGLQADVAPPETAALAAIVSGADAELMAIMAQADAGRYDAAKDAIEALLPRVLEIDYAPVQARGHRARGKIRSLRGEYEAAEADFIAAYRIALEVGDDRSAASGAISLAVTLGINEARYDAAGTWVETAMALAARVEPGGYLVGQALNAGGVLLHRKAEYANAVANFDRAIEIFEPLGDDVPDLGHALNHLGATLDELERYEEAEAHFRRAMDLAQKRFGPQHPAATQSMGNLALNLQFQGRYDDALELQMRALKVREAALDPDHDTLALTHNNIGWTLFEQGRVDEAVVHFQTAVDKFERRLGPKHARVAMGLEGLAAAKMRLREFDQALALHRRSMAIRVEVVGPEHPNVASSHMGLADVLAQQDRYDEALVETRKALAILEKNPEATRFLLGALRQEGQLLLKLEQPKLAKPPLERAVALADVGAPARFAGVYFALARAVLAADGDRERAFKLAREAQAALATIDGGGPPKMLADIDAFLAR